jgi:hypothetical protein
MGLYIYTDVIFIPAPCFEFIQAYDISFLGEERQVFEIFPIEHLEIGAYFIPLSSPAATNVSGVTRRVPCRISCPLDLIQMNSDMVLVNAADIIIQRKVVPCKSMELIRSCLTGNW